MIQELVQTTKKMIVVFIPYIRLLIFGILVTLVTWFSFCFFRPVHLALQNVNKDYVIFSYFRNFAAKSDQKPKTKNGMSKTLEWLELFIYYQCVSLLSHSLESSFSFSQRLVRKASSSP